MYRLLEVGEVIEKGDEYWIGSTRQWVANRGSIGTRVRESDGPQRRLVKPAVTPIPCKADPWHVSNQPDPGEGYRLIDKAVDKPERWDEIWDTVSHKWSLRDRSFYSEPYFPNNVYRRKLPAVPAVDPGEGWRLLSDGETIQQGDQITTTGHRWYDVSSSIGRKIDAEYSGKGTWSWRRRVTPVVSVGDRVKVLSGPWAGCTGVVKAFGFRATPQRTLEQTDVEIVFDNVHVGGRKLVEMFRFSAVEPLLPVVPEVLYRDLSHGETVKAGDEFLNSVTKKWQVRTVDSSVLLSGHHVRHRRPVRLQSPGWRYLDAGETVQAGDEHRFFGPWELCGSSVGKTMTDEDGRTGQIRRKLPANQGG